MLDVRGAPFVAIARAKGLSRPRSPSATCSATRSSRCSRCSASRCRRSSPARCSSRRSSPGPGSAGCWSKAVQARDYPVVMAATAVSAVLVVLGNLLAEAAGGMGRSAGPAAMARETADEAAPRHLSPTAAPLFGARGPRGRGARRALRAAARRAIPLLQRDIVATRFLPPLSHRSPRPVPPARHRPVRPRRLGPAALRRASLARRRGARGAGVGRRGRRDRRGGGLLARVARGRAARPHRFRARAAAGGAAAAARLALAAERGAGGRGAGTHRLDDDRAAGPRRGARARHPPVRRGRRRARRGGRPGCSCGTFFPTR